MDSCEFDLSFPMLEYGATETPWDLKPFLFRGGASERVKRVALQISQGELGSILTERIELVRLLHEHLTADLAGGGSRFSVKNKIHALRTFFSWADSEGFDLSLETIPNIFVRWSDHLRHRHLVERSLSEASIYDLARLTATILDRILGRQSSLSKSTRVRKPRGKGKVHLSKADKQSLHNTFLFGHFLADICDSLTAEATVGPLPVCIRFRTGQVLEHWSGLPRPDKLAARLTKPRHPSEKEIKRLRRLAWEEDRTLRTRQSLVNLRIQSELLIFIAQTGLNLQQAHTLRLEQFHYTSHLDGYQVRTYKNRREGEVLFEIFSGYRNWLQRYLEWRSEWFDDEPDGLLFPLMRSGGRIQEKATQFEHIKRISHELGVPMVTPRQLRGTRINWLLRETRNPSQVAEWAQHTTETLIRVYADPHPHTSMIEIARFHQQTDPFLSPPAPGRCVSASPESLDLAPDNAPRPDCINAAGCLFCSQHRDIESEDHVWSLSSLRHLKSLELARYRPPTLQLATVHPALVVIDRLTAKLRFFEESSEVRRVWVEEASARIIEGNYHPAWEGFIRLAELRQNI
ncbi:site-specific integrase [Enterobacter asburiae]|uniref:site-specific integrase n=1 Tax=Enterobacter asburiae TaxID=61645 RepID=UPI0018ECAFCF|nr:site-specific integrase [Enterobacter asburiae]MBJ6588686.1 site-specific integrase [Enterobacter asburiae]HAS1942836.1 site-specific integrase [Enterobacter asburiae]